MININQLQDKIKTCFISYTKQVITQPTRHLIQTMLGDLNSIIHGLSFGFYVYDEWKCSYKLISQSHKKEQNKFVPVLKEINQLQNKEQIISDKKVFLVDHGDLQVYVFKLNEGEDTKPVYFVMQFKRQTLSSTFLSFLYDEMNQFVHLFQYVKNNEWKQKRRKLLNDIASKMYSTTNRSKVLQIIVEHIQTIYPNVKYDILLSQDYEPVNCRMPIKELQLSGDVNNASDKAFLTGKIQMKRHGNSTFLYAPLTGHQGVYGVIRTQALNCKKIPQNEIDFIKEFADIAGQALENVMLYQSSITLVSNLQLINKATHQLNKNVNLAELTTTIKQYIKNASKAQEIGIFYLDQEKNTELRIAQESTSFFQSKAGSTLANLLMDDIKEKPEIFSGNFTSYYPNFRYESLMFIPMTQSGETFGGIVVLHEEKFYFPFENFKLMQSLIQHYTLAVTNTFLKERLKEAVITDYLTKLYARNHLDAMIKEDMETGMFGTFILFDIDDFKRINDTYGHFIGDEVIIQIADIVKTNTSEKDVPAR